MKSPVYNKNHVGLNDSGVESSSRYSTRSANIVNKTNILIDLSESDKTKFGKQDFATQSVPQQVFSSIWAVESEVNNGGFSQYFLNNSSETAAFVGEALDTIGAPSTADICRRAIATAFPMGAAVYARCDFHDSRGLS